MRRLALAFCLLAAPLAAQDNPVTVTPVIAATTTASGQPIPLPTETPEVLVSRFRIAEGAELPVHKHPHPRMAYVLSGRLVVTNDETGEETAYAPGQFVIEMVDTWHHGRADGPDEVELLVIDLVPKGTSNTITR